MENDDRPRFRPLDYRTMVETCVDALRVKNQLGAMPARDLVIRTLLHLPRFPPEALTLPTIAEETHRLAARALQHCATLADKIPPPTDAPVTALQVREVDPASAWMISRCLHYIGTDRSMIASLGLYRSDGTPPELPLTMAVLSQFDLGNVTAVFPELSADSTIVVSRMYAFPWSPHNSLSMLLRHVREWSRRHVPSARWLITYVNPNLGFQAASYRADNWTLVGTERFDAYYDENGDYVTPRVRRDQSPLTARREATSLTASRWRLEPLMLYLRSISGDSWRATPVAFEPWPALLNS
jgi:hypothetical protein